jgi:hypothetical protein
MYASPIEGPQALTWGSGRGAQVTLNGDATLLQGGVVSGERSGPQGLSYQRSIRPPVLPGQAGEPQERFDYRVGVPTAPTGAKFTVSGDRVPDAGVTVSGGITDGEVTDRPGLNYRSTYASPGAGGRKYLPGQAGAGNQLNRPRGAAADGGTVYYNDFNGPGGIGGGGGGAGGAGGMSAGLAMAHGTFSLPVHLPVHAAGGVQWDFQGPGDKPTVSILAVDERLIEGAHSTAAVLVIALACWLVWKVGRQIFRRAEPAPRLLAAYVLLAVATAGLVAAGGVSVPTGLLVFGAILVPVELLHRLLARRVPAGAR